MPEQLIHVLGMQATSQRLSALDQRLAAVEAERNALLVERRALVGRHVQAATSQTLKHQIQLQRYKEEIGMDWAGTQIGRFGNQTWTTAPSFLWASWTGQLPDIFCKCMPLKRGVLCIVFSPFVGEVFGVPPGGATASLLSIAELGHCKGEDKGKENRAFESQPEVIPFCL